MIEQGLRPEPLPKPLKMVDGLMRPFMYTLGGFKQDSIQETHPWHVQAVDPSLINPDLSATIRGSALESMQSHNFFLFHAPIFGGWRHYTLFESSEEKFHIGWANRVNGKLAQAAIHRLTLSDGRVRMLNGPGNSETDFFAVNPDGTQIHIQAAGTGVLGDNQFPQTRLL